MNTRAICFFAIVFIYGCSSPRSELAVDESINESSLDTNELTTNAPSNESLRLANVKWSLSKTSSSDGMEANISNESRYEYIFREINDGSNLGVYNANLNCTAVEGIYRFDNDILMLTMQVLDEAPCPDYEPLELASLLVFQRGFDGSPLIATFSQTSLILTLEDNSTMVFDNVESPSPL